MVRTLMTRSRVGILVLVLLGACGSTAPIPTPRLGRYAFTANLATAGSSVAHPVSGTLVLSYASADSVAGTMQGSLDFGPLVRLGFKNGDAYYVVFDVKYYQQGITGNLNARLRPVDGSLVCDRAIMVPEMQDAASCGISYVGP